MKFNVTGLSTWESQPVFYSRRDVTEHPKSKKRLKRWQKWFSKLYLMPRLKKLKKSMCNKALTLGDQTARKCFPTIHISVVVLRYLNMKMLVAPLNAMLEYKNWPNIA